MKGKLETLAIHAGYDPDEMTGAVTPPIHLSTTFERAEDGSYPKGFSYTRSDNPTRQGLERTLAVIEDGSDCAAFSSGSAAASAIFKSLGAGAHVLIPSEMYHGLRKLIREGLEPWGL